MTPRRISRVTLICAIPRLRGGSVRASTLGTAQSTPFSRFQWAAAKSGSWRCYPLASPAEVTLAEETLEAVTWCLAAWLFAMSGCLRCIALSFTLPAFLLQRLLAFLLLFTLAFIFFPLVAHFDLFSLVVSSKGNHRFLW